LSGIEREREREREEEEREEEVRRSGIVLRAVNESLINIITR